MVVAGGWLYDPPYTLSGLDLFSMSPGGPPNRKVVRRPSVSPEVHFFKIIFESRVGNRRFLGVQAAPCSPKATEQGGGPRPPTVSYMFFGSPGAVRTPKHRRLPARLLKIRDFGPLGRASIHVLFVFGRETTYRGRVPTSTKV